MLLRPCAKPSVLTSLCSSFLPECHSRIYLQVRYTDEGFSEESSVLPVAARRLLKSARIYLRCADWAAHTNKQRDQDKKIQSLHGRPSCPPSNDTVDDDDDGSTPAVLSHDQLRRRTHKGWSYQAPVSLV